MSFGVTDHVARSLLQPLLQEADLCVVLLLLHPVVQRHQRVPLLLVYYASEHAHALTGSLDDVDAFGNRHLLVVVIVVIGVHVAARLFGFVVE